MKIPEIKIGKYVTKIDIPTKHSTHAVFATNTPVEFEEMRLIGKPVRNSSWYEVARLEALHKPYMPEVQPYDLLYVYSFCRDGKLLYSRL